MKSTDRIQRYLDGEMSQKELKQFRSDLQRSPELMEELDLHRLIEKSIKTKDEQTFRKKLEESYTRYRGKKETGVNKKPRPRPLVRIILYSLAALFVIGLFFIIDNQKPDTNKLFEAYYEPGELDFGSRNAEIDLVHANLLAGLEAYKDGNYKLCKLNIERHLSTGSEVPVIANYYLGLSHIELGDYGSAELNFISIIEDRESYYTEYAKWYLALVYLKENKPGEAKKLFTEISRGPSPFSEKSARIIKKIPDLN